MITSPDKEDDMSILPDEIPVDQHVTSYDPDHDETANSAFTLASTLYDFSYEHGRRYPQHRYGSHPFPHDDLSVKNDKILHHMLLYLFDNRHFLCPVENPRFILDVKCNEGLWAQNMADAYPDSHIVAMDTTPAPSSAYPNLSFVMQSFTDEWILDEPDMKFDFIYARSLFAATGDFEMLYQQAFNNLRPGGHFEQIEIEIVPRCDDDSSDPNSTIQLFASLTQRMSQASGTEYNIAPMMKDLIVRAGFIDVVETRLKLPVGPWSADPKYKQIGEWFEAFYKSGLQGWVLAPLTRSGFMTPEQVDIKCEEAFRELDLRQQHVYFTAVIVYCRKPE